MAFLCQCRRQRKWATSPHTLPSSNTWMKLGSSGNSLSYGLVCSSLREALPNEGAVPGHMETWKSIQELQQIVTELGRRQATFEPAPESSNQATFTSGMKVRLLHSALRPWYGMIISMLCPVKGQDIYSVGRSTADLEETEKSSEQIHTMGKTQNRELKKPKDYINSEGSSIDAVASAPQYCQRVAK